MQVDNLRPEDIEKMKDAFKEIKQENPDAIMEVLTQGDSLPDKCCFKDSCEANKPFWKKIFKKRRPR